ncbi:MAG: sensor histidine kinase [Streptosporangiaceae bacterium]
MLRQRTLRMQLALLYAGVFAALGVALLAALGVALGVALVRRGSSAARAGATGLAGAQPVADGRHLDLSPAALGLAAAFGVTVLVALALGWLIAGRLLRPLRTITATARDISASNLNRRFGLGGRHDEFAELGETLDGLFGRLEASFQSQRHFVANASHELRTPLAAERTLLQVALADPDVTVQTLRTACGKALKWNDQEERLIEALLTLASSERGVERWEPFDLAEIAQKAILDRRQDAGCRGIAIAAELSAAPATGDPSLAASLVANLVDNAIRHNRDAGQVQISTTITDGLAVVSVSNTGTLIPHDEVDRLFQPFQRLGTERIRQASGHGHGLGLAIVRAIAGVHGATLTAKAGAEGGLDIEVSFP